MKRHGSTSVTVAISLTVLLGFAAIAVDIGLARHNRQLLSNAAEAAAHAGAAKLDGQAASLDDARATALAVGAENVVDGRPVDLDANDANAADGDVVLGYWDGTSLVPSDDPQLVTAVQVVAHREDLPSFFAEAMFGREYLSAGDFAIAQAGGPSASACPLPIALADCELAAIKAGGCSSDILLTSSRVDNGAWGRPGTSTPSATYVRDALDRVTCAAESEIGESLTLNNGSVTSGLSQLTTAINASSDTWSTSAWGAQPAQMTGSKVSPYGRVLKGQVLVFHDPGNCANIQYNGTRPLVGYATAAVYDVVPTGGDKKFRLRVICDEADGAGGGTYFGTTVPPSFLR